MISNHTCCCVGGHRRRRVRDSHVPAELLLVVLPGLPSGHGVYAAAAGVAPVVRRGRQVRRGRVVGVTSPLVSYPAAAAGGVLWGHPPQGVQQSVLSRGPRGVARGCRRTSGSSPTTLSPTAVASPLTGEVDWVGLGQGRRPKKRSYKLYLSCSGLPRVHAHF